MHFYPRPPGGGRLFPLVHGRVLLHISIHALRVEGDNKADHVCQCLRISIHALRVEGDRPASTPKAAGSLFLSTPSGWRATVVRYDLHLPVKISIHALRVEGDTDPAKRKGKSYNFYPRPPGGGRLHNALKALSGDVFLSTPSGWRATYDSYYFNGLLSISIHALRVEGDQHRVRCNPERKISIHALRVEGD